jgi:hypothetical protein
MNLVELQRKLIAAARATPPDDRVPYAFEKRIMARLYEKTVVDPWGLWGRAFSRAAIFCVLFMLLVSAGSFLLPAGNSEPLSQDFEQVLYSAMDNSNNPVDPQAW